jgi:hypothetical protein
LKCGRRRPPGRCPPANAEHCTREARSTLGGQGVYKLAPSRRLPCLGHLSPLPSDCAANVGAAAYTVTRSLGDGGVGWTG